MSDLREIVLEPPPADWLDLLADGFTHRRESLFGRPVEAWMRECQEEMLPGFPASGRMSAESHVTPVVIGTGHQAGFWHAGILSKYLALDEFASRIGAAMLELVVDQDVNDPLALGVPVVTDVRRTSSSEGTRFESDVVRLDHPRGDCVVRCDETWAVPLACRKPISFRVDEAFANGPDAHRVSPGIVKCIDSMRAALANAYADSHSLAGQVALANSAMRGRSFVWSPGSGQQEDNGMRTAQERDDRQGVRYLVMATQLSKTGLYRALVDEMRRDPVHVFETYNAAAARFPHARITPLDRQGACDDRADGFEIPLWRIDPHTCRRQRACVGDLYDGRALLWPRALMMTAIVRIGLVDLFIHGRGGDEYERVTEQWIADWLDVSLAPKVTVSATMLLDFGIEPATADDLSQARWFAHHLQYNLDRHVENESEASRRKAQLIAGIEAAPRRSTARLAMYLELQELNRELRTRHADEIKRADQRITERADALAESNVLLDRTWAFPFHGEDGIRALTSAIAKRMVGVGNECEGRRRTEFGEPGSRPVPVDRSDLSCGCQSVD